MQSPFTLLLQGTVTPTNTNSAGSPSVALGNQLRSGEKIELVTQLPTDAPLSGPAEQAMGDNFAGIYAQYSETLQPEPHSTATRYTDDLSLTQANGILQPEQSLLAAGALISSPHQAVTADVDSALTSTAQSGLVGDESGATLPQAGRTLPLYSQADSSGNPIAGIEALQSSSKPEIKDILAPPPGTKSLPVNVPQVEPIAPTIYPDRVDSFNGSNSTAEPSLTLQSSVGLVDAQPIAKTESLAEPTANQSIDQQATVDVAAAVQAVDQDSAELLPTEASPQSVERASADTIESLALTVSAVSTEQNSKPQQVNQSPVAGPVSSIAQFIARARQNQPLNIDDTALDSTRLNATAVLPVTPEMQLIKEATRAITGEVAQEAQKQQSQPLAATLFETSTAHRRDGVQSGIVSLANSPHSMPTAANFTATVDTTMANIAGAEPSLQDIPDGQSDLTTVIKRPEAGGQQPPSTSPGGATLTDKLPSFDGPLSFNRAGWSEALSQRITLLHGKNIEQAQIQLDPPELGSLQVKINMQGDQVSVHFTSAHGVVRDALDQTSQRLAQFFNDEGIELLNVSVSDGQAEGDRSAQSENGHAEDVETDLPGNGEDLTQLTISRPDNGQIDYFV